MKMILLSISLVASVTASTIIADNLTCKGKTLSTGCTNAVTIAANNCKKSFGPSHCDPCNNIYFHAAEPEGSDQSATASCKRHTYFHEDLVKCVQGYQAVQRACDLPVSPTPTANEMGNKRH